MTRGLAETPYSGSTWELEHWASKNAIAAQAPTGAHRRNAAERQNLALDRRRIVPRPCPGRTYQILAWSHCGGNARPPLHSERAVAAARRGEGRGTARLPRSAP